MICFDTNIVIYIANGTLSEAVADSGPIVYPSVVRVEALGYHKILAAEEQKVRRLLATLEEIQLDNPIIELAIRLRQSKKMSLGDAIIAATAIESDAILWTANEPDFADIESLRVYNPLKRA
jgi:predicted nucleic acid-binding protein